MSKEVDVNIQYNLNGSNTDGSFTVDDSNSFFSPYKILPIAKENKYLGIFSYFIMELFVVCTHKNRLIEAIPMSTLNIQSLCRKSKRFHYIIAICFLNWCHDKPSVARTTHVSNKFSWSQRCSSH